MMFQKYSIIFSQTATGSMVLKCIGQQNAPLASYCSPYRLVLHLNEFMQDVHGCESTAGTVFWRFMTTVLWLSVCVLNSRALAIFIRHPMAYSCWERQQLVQNYTSVDGVHAKAGFREIWTVERVMVTQRLIAGRLLVSRVVNFWKFIVSRNFPEILAKAWTLYCL